MTSNSTLIEALIKIDGVLLRVKKEPAGSVSLSFDSTLNQYENLYLDAETASKLGSIIQAMVKGEANE